MARPFTITPDGIRLAVRVTPNASRNVLEEPQIRDDGQCVLRARVTAAPDKGKANKALIALLAKHLHVPKSAMKIVSGPTSRLKVIQIHSDPQSLQPALSGWTV